VGITEKKQVINERGLPHNLTSLRKADPSSSENTNWEWTGGRQNSPDVQARRKKNEKICRSQGDISFRGEIQTKGDTKVGF